MDQAALSSSSVLEALLKTNRPPTDEEKAIIQESMAPTNAKLSVVEAQISDTMAHIQALKLQIEEREIKLQRLHEEKAAILETFADHRRVFSPFRNLPEDVLREICIACVEDSAPTLTYRTTPLPYRLAQISSEMRHVALTAPFIWASMYIDYGTFGSKRDTQAYSILARRASEWFERAGGLALTIFIQDPSWPHSRFKRGESDPSSILFDTIFSYSTRWKEIKFESSCQVTSPLMVRIAALAAVDVPLLQSVSLEFDLSTPSSALHNIALLNIPTLKRVLLQTNNVRKFTVNWAALTSVTLHGKMDSHCLSKNEIAIILQQTKCLAYCDVYVCPAAFTERVEFHYTVKINLPFLETFHIDERSFRSASSGTSSLLDLITAPALKIFHIRSGFLELSLLEFIQKSPNIWNLSLPYLKRDKSLTITLGILRHCHIGGTRI
ncbi:hypothetical protein HYPSUDRAFT_49363 [Hypholoma sublateritium FD-334 SS-4]|uniref:F-box domain-containing protein n=1 Tax=Hypholoma sublateritium (strain FD-334 SS-4) TaxID=945553 RepID=A0A0D2N4Z8_HYPSF|nr:hypothetical protein HYPSUDRAFT_49363 [Hypholoma sublateritium FD-334 SS-4]